MKTYLIFGAWLLSSLAQNAWTQESLSAEIESIDVGLLRTPQLDDRKRTPAAQQWQEVEVEFTLSGRAPNELASEIRVEFYLVLSDGVTLHQVTEYENIVLRKPTHAAVYLSPGTRRALLLADDPRVSILGAAVEIYDRQGQLLANESTNRVRKTQQLSRKELRQKSETPFAMLWWDRYAEESLTE